MTTKAKCPSSSASVFRTYSHEVAVVVALDQVRTVSASVSEVNVWPSAARLPQLAVVLDDVR